MNTTTPITPVSTPLNTPSHNKRHNTIPTPVSSTPLTSSIGSPLHQSASLSHSNLYSTPVISRNVSMDSLSFDNLYVSDSAVESGSHEVLSNSPKSLKPLAGMRANDEYLKVEEMAVALNEELKDHTYKDPHLLEQAFPQEALPKEFVPKLAGLCEYLKKNDSHRPEYLDVYFTSGNSGDTSKTRAGSVPQQPSSPPVQSQTASTSRAKGKATAQTGTAAKDSDEEAYKRWFNHLAEDLDNYLKQSCGRRFTAQHADTPVKGVTPEKRKPDLVLIVGESMDPIGTGNWATLLAIYEITKSTDFPPRISKQASQRASLLLKNCPGRRFVPVVCVSGREFMYSVFHRSGLTRSMRYDIVKNIYEFYYILLCLLFCSLDILGFDPSIEYNELGAPIQINLAGENYTILENLFVREGIQGRGTVCWRVQCDRTGKVYMLKIAWIDIMRKNFERDFYKRLEEKGIIGVPRLVWEAISMINGVEDSTERWRPPKSVGGNDFVVRKCHKLLLDGVGRPITSFRSKYELFSAYIDIVKAHMRLCFIAKILHRDASLWNLYIIDKYPKYKPKLDPKQVAVSSRNEESSSPKQNIGNEPQYLTSSPALQARGGSLTSTVQGVQNRGEAAHASSNDNSGVRAPPIFSSHDLDSILNDKSARLSLWQAIISGSDEADTEEADVFSQSRTVGRGMLSDFDYSSFIAEFKRAADDPGFKAYLESVEKELRTRTGTLPFMSIEVLLGAVEGQDFFHKYKDDIESIIYGFISICINYAGPNGVLRDFSKEPLPKIYSGLARSPFETWKQSGMSWVELGITKAGTWAHLEDWVIPCFHKYFNDMKALFMDLEKALWPAPPVMTPRDYTRRVNSPINYIDVIQILMYHRDRVSEPEPPVPKPNLNVKQGGGPSNTKGPGPSTGSAAGGVRRSPRLHLSSLPESSHRPTT